VKPKLTSAVDAVRARPGMYIGDTHDGSGLHHLVWEVLSNSLDEHLAGHCSTVSIQILADSSVRIEDDGRGIPIHDVQGIPFAQQALTHYHQTPTLDGHAPHEHVGLHGCGIFAVNAVSAWLTLEVFRAGRRHRQRYERGIPMTPLEDLEPTQRTGTIIHFLPDPTIFSDTWFDPGKIAARLRELVCLVPPLKVLFDDQRHHEFHEPTGLAVFLERWRRPGASRLAPLIVSGRVADLQVDAAMEWQPDARTIVESYANIERTTEGGTHVHGLLAGLSRGLRIASGNRLAGRTAERIRELATRGLRAVVCVRLRDPTFDGPTRSRLSTPAARKAVHREIARAFSERLRNDPMLLDHLLSPEANTDPEEPRSGPRIRP
jgi:DNA gyrase subunit B